MRIKGTSASSPRAAWQLSQEEAPSGILSPTQSRRLALCGPFSFSCMPFTVRCKAMSTSMLYTISKNRIFNSTKGCQVGLQGLHRMLLQQNDQQSIVGRLVQQIATGMHQVINVSQVGKDTHVKDHEHKPSRKKKVKTQVKKQKEQKLNTVKQLRNPTIGQAGTSCQQSIPRPKAWKKINFLNFISKRDQKQAKRKMVQKARKHFKSIRFWLNV